MTRHDDVGVEIVVEDGDQHGHSRPIVLRLGWRRDEPMAVQFTLRGIPDHPVLYWGDWAILRDFLRYGLEEPTGDGDVRITPESPAGTIRLDLGSAGGRPCAVRLPMATVRGFLAATEAIVPSGEEASEALLEALIERLLQR
ncbi:MAG TPA: SsgA family sporulation/cell division regulator [Mycobacteriales bacterium]|nr:SsgA family sporulation/cell division regulator [Mycobacteriales bacterium]